MFHTLSIFFVIFNEPYVAVYSDVCNILEDFSKILE